MNLQVHKVTFMNSITMHYMLLVCDKVYIYIYYVEGSISHILCSYVEGSK